MVSDIGALYTSNVQGTVCQEIDCRPNNTVYGPFIIFFFYTLSETLTGKEFREIKLLLRERYVKTIFTAYKVWSFVQAVNFSLVPLQHRAYFV